MIQCLGVVTLSGIDLVAHTVRHENAHVQQIFESNSCDYFNKAANPLRDAPAAGWALSAEGVPIPRGDPRYNHFQDIDGNGVLNSPPDVDLDVDTDGLCDTYDPAGLTLEGDAEGRACYTKLILQPAERERLKPYDWGAPGKQHGKGEWNGGAPCRATLPRLACEWP